MARYNITSDACATYALEPTDSEFGAEISDDLVRRCRECCEEMAAIKKQIESAVAQSEMQRAMRRHR